MNFIKASSNKSYASENGRTTVVNTYGFTEQDQAALAEAANKFAARQQGIKRGLGSLNSELDRDDNVVNRITNKLRKYAETDRLLSSQNKNVSRNVTTTSNESSRSIQTYTPSQQNRSDSKQSNGTVTNTVKRGTRLTKEALKQRTIEVLEEISRRDKRRSVSNRKSTFTPDSNEHNNEEELKAHQDLLHEDAIFGPVSSKDTSHSYTEELQELKRIERRAKIRNQILENLENKPTEKRVEEHTQFYDSSEDEKAVKEDVDEDSDDSFDFDAVYALKPDESKIKKCRQHVRSESPAKANTGDSMLHSGIPLYKYLRVDDLVRAQWNDDNWYDARIDGITHQGYINAKYKVWFIDYEHHAEDLEVNRMRFVYRPSEEVIQSIQAPKSQAKPSFFAALKHKTQSQPVDKSNTKSVDRDAETSKPQRSSWRDKLRQRRAEAAKSSHNDKTLVEQSVVRETADQTPSVSINESPSSTIYNSVIQSAIRRPTLPSAKLEYTSRSAKADVAVNEEVQRKTGGWRARLAKAKHNQAS